MLLDTEVRKQYTRSLSACHGTAEWPAGCSNALTFTGDDVFPNCLEFLGNSRIKTSGKGSGHNVMCARSYRNRWIFIDRVIHKTNANNNYLPIVDISRARSSRSLSSNKFLPLLHDIVHKISIILLAMTIVPSEGKRSRLSLTKTIH